MSALPVRSISSAPMPSASVVAVCDELLGHLPLHDVRPIAERIVGRLAYVLWSELAEERDEARAQVGRWRSERVAEWLGALGVDEGVA